MSLAETPPRTKTPPAVQVTAGPAVRSGGKIRISASRRTKSRRRTGRKAATTPHRQPRASAGVAVGAPVVALEAVAGDGDGLNKSDECRRSCRTARSSRR